MPTPWDEMRIVSQMTGQIYEAQIDQIKKLGVLLFGHPVVIEIEYHDPTPDNVGLGTVTFIVEPNKNNHLNDKMDRVEMARAGIDKILGRGWNTQVTLNGTTSKPEPQPEGAKRPRRVSGKRKAPAKSKNKR